MDLPLRSARVHWFFPRISRHREWHRPATAAWARPVPFAAPAYRGFPASLVPSGNPLWRPAGVAAALALLRSVALLARSAVPSLAAQALAPGGGVRLVAQPSELRAGRLSSIRAAPVQAAAKASTTPAPPAAAARISASSRSLLLLACAGGGQKSSAQKSGTESAT